MCAEANVGRKNVKVWHQDGQGRVFLLLEQAPKDVTDDSATGSVLKVNYTNMNIDTTVGCLPAGKLPSWMSFKSQPKRGDTVFVGRHGYRTRDYRGSLLVEWKQNCRSRIVGISWMRYISGRKRRRRGRSMSCGISLCISGRRFVIVWLGLSEGWGAR